MTSFKYNEFWQTYNTTVLDWRFKKVDDEKLIVRLLVTCRYRKSTYLPFTYDSYKVIVENDGP